MGYIHIYCGDGKGKTTAAVGLAVRMAGSNGQAVMVRFLKNDDSGEVDCLRQIKGITVIPCKKTFGFTWQMTEAEKREASAYYKELFDEAADLALLTAEQGQTLFVMDEVCAAGITFVSLMTRQSPFLRYDRISRNTLCCISPVSLLSTRRREEERSSSGSWAISSSGKS